MAGTQQRLAWALLAAVASLAAAAAEHAAAEACDSTGLLQLSPARAASARSSAPVTAKLVVGPVHYDGEPIDLVALEPTLATRTFLEIKVSYTMQRSSTEAPNQKIFSFGEPGQGIGFVNRIFQQDLYFAAPVTRITGPVGLEPVKVEQTFSNHTGYEIYLNNGGEPVFSNAGIKLAPGPRSRWNVGGQTRGGGGPLFAPFQGTIKDFTVELTYPVGRCCYHMESCPAHVPQFGELQGCNFASEYCSANEVLCGRPQSEGGCGPQDGSSVWCPVTPEPPSPTPAPPPVGRCCYGMPACPSEVPATGELGGCNFADEFCSLSREACEMPVAAGGCDSGSGTIFCPVTGALLQSAAIARHNTSQDTGA